MSKTGAAAAAPPPPLAELPEKAATARLCIDMNRERGRDLGLGYLAELAGPGDRRATKRALREVGRMDPALLPGWDAREGEIWAASVADTNRDGAPELHVEYLLTAVGPGAPSNKVEEWNQAALSLPDHRVLWASTVVYHPGSPSMQTCSGFVRRIDADCDRHGDIVVFRTCHDTMCPHDDSPDAECHGETTERDLVWLWNPATRAYRPVRPATPRDAANDCGAHGRPVILCGPPM